MNSYPYFELNALNPLDTSNLEILQSKVNAYKNSYERLNFRNYLKIAEFFRFYNSPLYNHTITYKDIDSHIFTDYYDINGHVNNSIPANSISYRLDGVDGFPLNSLEVLVFGNEGTLLDPEDYYIRMLFGSLHVFIRKFRKSDQYQQLQNNKPVTFVVLKKEFPIIERPIITVNTDTTDFENVISNLALSNVRDLNYLVVYRKLPDESEFSILNTDLYYLTKNEENTVRIKVFGESITNTQYLILNTLETLKFEINFSYDKCDRLYSFNILSTEGCNIEPLDNREFFNELSIKLEVNVDNTLHFIRQIEAKDLLVFIKGNKLIPEKDYIIEKDGNDQYLKILLDIDFTTNGMIKVLMLRPFINNGSYYYHLPKIDNDLSRKGVIDTNDRRSVLGIYDSMFIFNNRRIVPLTNVNVLDETCLLIPDLFNENDLEIIFDYVTEDVIEELLTDYLNGESLFSQFVDTFQLEGDIESLRLQYLNDYVNENNITDCVFNSNNTDFHIGYNEYLTPVDYNGYNLILVNNQQILPLGILNDYSLKDRMVKLVLDKPKSSILVRHSMGHNIFTTQFSLDKEDISHSIEIQDSNSFILNLSEEVTGTIILIFDFVSREFTHAKNIAGMEDAPNNHYYGTNELGILGIWPIPDTPEISRPVILNKFNTHDLNQDLIINISNFNTLLGASFLSTMIIILDLNNNIVVYSKEFSSDSLVTIDTSELQTFLLSNTSYRLYVKHIAKENIESLNSIPLDFTSTITTELNVVPVFNSIPSIIYTDGNIEIVPYIDMVQRVISTRLQISSDSNFVNIVYDNINDRNLFINGKLNKFKISYKDLDRNTIYYIRAVYEFENFGYGKFSTVATVKTVKGLKGVAFNLNQTIELTDLYAHVYEDLIYVFSELGIQTYNLNKRLYSNVGVLGTTPEYRTNFASCKLSNTEFLISGGILNSTELNDLWKYNITTRRWTQLTDLPMNLKGHRLFYYNNELYLSGGSNNITVYNHLYKLENDIWVQVTISNPPARHNHLFVIKNDKLLLSAGDDSIIGLSDTWILDLNTLIWTQVTTIPNSNSGSESSYVLFDDLVYTYGGTKFENNDTIDKLMEFDFNDNLGWTDIPLTNNNVRGLTKGASFVYQNKMYLIGGITDDSEYFQIIEIK